MAERVGLEFLRAELHTGLTTANIAASAKDAQKKQRNHRMARKAYDTAMYFLEKSDLTESELAELKVQIEELRNALRALGEDV